MNTVVDCGGQAEGKNKGPKLTREEIVATINKTQYHRFPDTTTTICALTLTNGYVVTGESACISAENFNELLGNDIAYGNAVEKIWNLEGYLLKQRLFCFGK